MENEGEMFAHLDERTFYADGHTEEAAHMHGGEQATDKEIREHMEEHHGWDPETTEINRRTDGRNKGSASFSRWNSSWIPGTDPNMN